MTHCTHCRQELEAGVAVCPRCGHAISPEAVAAGELGEAAGSQAESQARSQGDGADGKPRRDKESDFALVGQVVAGKYRVLKLLGQGGFGSVFLVEMTEGIVGEPLAMKILPEEFGADPRLREQFVNEIRVAMRMVDKYIVQIRDVGITESGQLYYTMDYVPGKTLAQILREEKKLSVPRTLRIILRVLRALETAHAAGIIHRDLKPANIMVVAKQGRETVRVLDFGIATAIGSEPIEGRGFAGSPYYMPPEQFLGTEMSFYTDLYSVGVILYECLTGTKPYGGNTPQEVYQNIKKGPPVPVDVLAPEVKQYPGLAELVMQALERNPEKRIQSAREFFDRVNAILQAGAQENRSQSPRPALKTEAPAPAPRAKARTSRLRAPRAGKRAAARSRNPIGAVIVLFVLLGGVALAVVFHEDLVESLTRAGVLGARPGAQSGSTNGPVASPRPSGRQGPGERDVARTGEREGTARTGGPAGEAAERHGSTPETSQGSVPPAAPPRTGEGGRGKVPAKPGESEVPPASAVAEVIERYREEAQEAFSAREWIRVLEVTGDILDLRPEDPQALRMRAGALVEIGRAAEAVALLEKLRNPEAPDKDDPELLLLLAQAYSRLDPPPDRKIEEVLVAAWQKDPKDPRAPLRLIELYELHGKTEKIRKVVKIAKKHGVSDPKIESLYNEIFVEGPKRERERLAKLRETARTAFEKAEYAQAARAAQEYLSAGSSVELAGILAESRIRLGELDEAVEALSRLEGLLARPKGSSEEGQDDPAEVVESWRLKVPFLRGLLAYERYKQTGEETHLMDAELHFTRCIDELGRQGDGALAAQAYTYRGAVYAAKEDVDRMERDFRASKAAGMIRLLELQVRTIFELAERLKGREARMHAYELLRERANLLLQAQGLDDKLRAWALYHLALSYYRLGVLRDDDGNLLRKAANRFAQAKAAGWEKPELYDAWGDTYERLVNYIQAATYFRQAYELEPTPQRCLRAAENYLRANPLSQQARELLEDGVRRFPENQRLKRKLLELSR